MSYGASGRLCTFSTRVVTILIFFASAVSWITLTIRYLSLFRIRVIPVTHVYDCFATLFSLAPSPGGEGVTAFSFAAMELGAFVFAVFSLSLSLREPHGGMTSNNLDTSLSMVSEGDRE